MTCEDFRRQERREGVREELREEMNLILEIL
jgi:hypothetical protein